MIYYLLNVFFDFLESLCPGYKAVFVCLADDVQNKDLFCFKYFFSQVASSVERPAADGEEAEKSNGHVAEVFFYPLVVFV